MEALLTENSTNPSKCHFCLKMGIAKKSILFGDTWEEKYVEQVWLCSEHLWEYKQREGKFEQKKHE